MSQIQILKIFKDQFITFLDELIAQFPREPDLVIVRIFMKDQVPIADIMCHIVQQILPHEARIKRKDESFFLENKQLFQELSPESVIHFKKLWVSDRLDSEDREAIWQWFISFCTLAKKYKQTLGESKIVRTAAGGYQLL